MANLVVETCNLITPKILEYFETNHFEQLCINYVNEKVQQLFVKLMLTDEENYYMTEGVEIPQIPFFDNKPILGKLN